MPGVSGGALAAVFGLYERMISFLASLTKDFSLQNFKKDILFFLPVIIGALVGIFIFSVFLNQFFEHAYIQLTWFFVGCIVGTLPFLWVKAGKEGRKPVHIIVLILSLVTAILFLRFIASAFGGQIEINFYTWGLSGSLIALGIIVPGLSPSNLLLFLQLYAPMTKAIADLDFTAIIPIGLGGLLTVLVFSRLMAYVFSKAYGLLFHAIIGLVLASTILIIPMHFSFICLIALVLGILLALWMCKLEDEHKV